MLYQNALTRLDINLNAAYLYLDVARADSKYRMYRAFRDTSISLLTNSKQ